MFDDINDLYQQVILDHCKQPRNFHELPAATCSAQGRNPLCGDQLKLFLDTGRRQNQGHQLHRFGLLHFQGFGVAAHGIRERQNEI